MKTLLELLEKNGNRPFERINVTYYRFDGHKVETLFFAWLWGRGWPRTPRLRKRDEIPFHHMVIASKKNRLTWAITVTNINEPRARKRLCK